MPKVCTQVNGLHALYMHLFKASATTEAEPIIEGLKAARLDKRKTERRERWPKDLPVVEQILEPEEVKANPELFRFIGQEVSETLDYEPARFLCRRIVRRKYVSCAYKI